MFKRKLTIALGAAALAAGVAACGSSSNSSSNSGTASNAANTSSSKLPTVTMMVGGIDKQIYLPYQLAQSLGFYKKYGVNMQLSTEQNGGVGAETAMASGQVDMAGAWYVHTIDFQEKGKHVISVAQLSGAPGEREMCTKGTTITSPAQWKGKTVGVTDIGSGTDELTQYMAHRSGLATQQYNRAAVGAGPTFVAALEHQRIACGMTSQPTAGAVQTKGIGYTAINLATTSGAKQALGGAYPAAGVLAQALLGQLTPEGDPGRRRRAGGDDALDRHPQRGADRRRDAAGVRLQRPDDEDRLHQRARRRQGPVPARRDDARQRTADCVHDREVHRQRPTPDQPRRHVHQLVRDRREQARGIHEVTAAPGPGPSAHTRRSRALPATQRTGPRMQTPTVTLTSQLPSAHPRPGR